MKHGISETKLFWGLLLRFCGIRNRAQRALFLLFSGYAAGLAAVDSTFVTSDRRFDFDSRYTAAYHLADNLGPSEVNALLAFLARLPNEDNVGESALASIKNNVADRLVQQRILPRTLLKNFEDILNRDEQGDVWRVYIVQKMSDVYARLDNRDEKMEIARLLEKQSVSTSGKFAATSVLALERIDKLENGADRKLVVDCARKVVLNRNVNEAERASVLQVLKDYDPPMALHIARDALSDEHVGYSMKLSAIAVIGKIGNPSDATLIKPLLESSDIRLKTAATFAAKHFQ